MLPLLILVSRLAATLEDTTWGLDGEDPDNYEVTEIFQSVVWKTGAKNLKFKAFGEEFNLNVFPSHLLAPQAVVVKKSWDIVGNLTREHLEAVENDSDCHYIMQGNNTVAALTLCSEGEVSGIVVSKAHTVEVLPLRLSENEFVVETITSRVNHLHLVRRIKEVTAHDQKTKDQEIKKAEHIIEDPFSKTTKLSKRVLEIAVFLDSTAYKRFTEYFQKIGAKNLDEEIKHLLLSYINGIQAIYLLPSLGPGILFSIVRIEIQNGNEDPYNNYNGDREPFLYSFCKHQSRLNPLKDGDLGHWDIALLVTGLDMHIKGSDKGGKGPTLGLAPVGGICRHVYNCVVGELGVHGKRGQPHPSAGFAAVYVMAHELGHNLGMLHDDKDGCSRDGYIMSPTRGSKGETKWSSCSAEFLRKTDKLQCLHEDDATESLTVEVGKLPGEVWSADQQCQIFFLDQDSKVYPKQAIHSICYTIKCIRKGKRGFQRAGPALEGTKCGVQRWCHGGQCIEKETTNIVSVATSPSTETTTFNTTAPSTPLVTACTPVGTYNQVPGMFTWCVQNCFHNPSYCPASHCLCK